MKDGKQNCHIANLVSINNRGNQRIKFSYINVCVSDIFKKQKSYIPNRYIAFCTLGIDGVW